MICSLVVVGGSTEERLHIITGQIIRKAPILHFHMVKLKLWGFSVYCLDGGRCCLLHV